MNRLPSGLGQSADEATEKAARLELGFANLGKAGMGITAFGAAGAAIEVVGKSDELSRAGSIGAFLRF